mmetsp:Transcript_13647/g.29657  ORF Transcript_13647/g.29657 Transcript_13647/m.29657 type:complete len:205 (+) Transcript_13647:74-688(+)
MVFMLIKSATDVCCAQNNGLGQWVVDRVKNCGDAASTVAEELEATQPTQQKPQQQAAEPVSKPSMMSTGKFSNKDAHFMNLSWSKLPLKARKALETLGWTQTKWDTEKWCDIEDYWYEDLSTEQKAAAKELGWDASTWDEQCDDKDWKDLTATQQKAAKTAGFTQQMWDDDEWPEVEHKDWEDIGGDTKKALMVLGYNQWDWDE